MGKGNYKRTTTEAMAFLFFACCVFFAVICLAFSWVVGSCVGFRVTCMRCCCVASVNYWLCFLRRLVRLALVALSWRFGSFSRFGCDGDKVVQGILIVPRRAFESRTYWYVYFHALNNSPAPVSFGFCWLGRRGSATSRNGLSLHVCTGGWAGCRRQAPSRPRRDQGKGLEIPTRRRVSLIEGWTSADAFSTIPCL